MSETRPLSRPVARTGSEMVLRVLFGLFLALVAVVLDFLSPLWFAGVVGLVALLAAREWHRMVRGPAPAGVHDQRPLYLQAAVTTIMIIAAMAALLAHLPILAFALLALGGVAAFAVALRIGNQPVWHAVGVIYLGLPALALVGLRSLTVQGSLIVLGLFIIVWATDTGALLFGKLVGGKRMAPRLSPGKTWAGTVGGSVCAAVLFGLYIAFFDFNMLLAAPFAFLFSFTAHGGDLLESAIKRHFGRKDSGSMIPGHGGVLDRMDSTFAASVVMALLVFVFHFNPMFGGHP